MQKYKNTQETQRHYCTAVTAFQYCSTLLYTTACMTANELCIRIMRTLRRMTSSWDISEVRFWAFVCIRKRRVTPSFWTYLSSMFSGLLNAFHAFRAKDNLTLWSVPNTLFQSKRAMMSSDSAWLIRWIFVYNRRFDPAALLRMAGNGMLQCNNDTFTSVTWVTGFFDCRYDNITDGLINGWLTGCTMKVLKECAGGRRPYGTCLFVFLISHAN